MRIRSIRHRGLRRFVETDDAREIRTDLVNRGRRILTALIAAQDLDGGKGPPGWRLHQLTGDRAGTWSLSVSGNCGSPSRWKMASSALWTWRIITDERHTHRGRHTPVLARGVHPGQDFVEVGLVGLSGRRTAGGSPRDTVRSGEWQGGAVAGNGAACREGVRRQHGYAAAHAGVARQLRHAAAGGGDCGG